MCFFLFVNLNSDLLRNFYPGLPVHANAVDLNFISLPSELWFSIYMYVHTEDLGFVGTNSSSAFWGTCRARSEPNSRLKILRNLTPSSAAASLEDVIAYVLDSG
jgi:hypothetical protein